MKRVLVWDVPTRLFHWLLVVSFGGAWLTSESDRWLAAHAFFGYLMLGLIAFRVAWGFVGGRYARFASFLYGPLAGMAYLRQMMSRSAARHVGHNPAGSQAIFMLLFLGLAVAVTGLFTLGGEEQQSGFGFPVSIDIGTWFRMAHELAAKVMLVIVIGHVAGVVVESLLHKENLARSMITGIKEAPDDTPASKRHLLVALMLVPIVAGLGIWWFFLATHQPLETGEAAREGKAANPRVALVGRKLPDDPLWREECGSCHVPFHPNLLPARSWHALMAGQADHFGSDLGLDAATVQTLLAFLDANAAERSAREAAFKINRSIKPWETPIRITETPYWLEKHREIAPPVWSLPAVKSRSNCDACHLDAKEGTFEDAAIRLPR